jgi:hypothetical protein
MSNINNNRPLNISPMPAPEQQTQDASQTGTHPTTGAQVAQHPVDAQQSSQAPSTLRPKAQAFLKELEASRTGPSTRSDGSKTERKAIVSKSPTRNKKPVTLLPRPKKRLPPNPRRIPRMAGLPNSTILCRRLDATFKIMMETLSAPASSHLTKVAIMRRVASRIIILRPRYIPIPIIQLPTTPLFIHPSIRRSIHKFRRVGRTVILLRSAINQCLIRIFSKKGRSRQRRFSASTISIIFAITPSIRVMSSKWTR